MSLITAAALAAQTAAIPPNLILPNYDRIPIGQREGIEAGAFLARTNDASANWYNPAGLGRSLHTALNASATAYEWTSIGLEGFGASEGRSRINTIGTLFAVVLGDNVVRSDRWRLGFAITRPVTWRPSSIDMAFPLMGGDELLAYASDVEFGVTVHSLGVAFSPGGVSSSKFRVGASLGVGLTSLVQSQEVSDRVTTGASATVSERSFSAEGSVWDVQPSLGVQWDPGNTFRLGARVVAPSIRVTGGSRINLQNSRFATGGSTDLVFRDESAEFDYQRPLEAVFGAAYLGRHAELEVDVHYYGPIDSYELYTSAEPGRLTTIDAGGTPVVTAVPFTATLNSARSLVNLSVGANYRLSGGFRIHAGYATDASPVDDESLSVFRKVDLSRLTGGVSLTGRRLSGSLGVGYSFGAGTRQTLGSTEGGQQTETRFEVSTMNLLFAFSFSFQER
jgi:hypothetical protein